MKFKLMVLAVLVPGIIMAQPAPNAPDPSQSTPLPMDQRTTTSMPQEITTNTTTPNVATQTASGIKGEEKINSKNCIQVKNDPYMTNICN
jgi:hypothetical protein